jgi:hypothetical protein
MKNDIQAALYAEMKGLSPEEQRAFIHAKAAEFWRRVGRERPVVKKGVA